MIKFDENGQGYIEFTEGHLEVMNYDQLETVLKIVEARYNNATDLKLRIKLNNLISRILLQMAYKMWEV